MGKNFTFTIKLIVFSFFIFIGAFWISQIFFSLLQKYQALREIKYIPNVARVEPTTSTPQGEGQHVIFSPPLEEEDPSLLPSSFTDLFSSLVYINSVSPEIKYEKELTAFSFYSSSTFSVKDWPFFISSANLNNYEASVVKARISEVDMNIEHGEVVWLLSNDGISWSRVKMGEYFKFPRPEGKKLFWRAEFYPGPKKELKFFFDRILIDYLVKF